MNSIASKWDDIYDQAELSDCRAAEVLADNAYLLPQGATALDLACGLGANARFLAEAGLAVCAWDISLVAIEKLRRFADLKGLSIQTRQCLIDCKTLSEHRFDVIVVSRFLDRTLSDAIIGALNPGGLLFYQTFTREKAFDTGPKNADFLLADGELLKLFGELQPVYYRDNGTIGDISFGFRNQAQFIGRKRSLPLR